MICSQPHSATYVITEYDARDRRDVHNLLYDNLRVQTHLDWYEAEQWLASQSKAAWLAWQGARLVGLLGVSAPIDAASWVRVIGVRDGADASGVLRALWERATPHLKARGVQQVALLILQDWAAAYAPKLGFWRSESIITLRRSGAPHTAPALNGEWRVRAATPADVERLWEVDHQAFSAPWHMQADELRQAQNLGAISTLALHGQTVVGYQISTLYLDGGHLARLAVLPRYQGYGVAKALLQDLVEHFAQRGVYNISVNTQASNMRSQKLYERFGFRRMGYDLHVWTSEL